MRRSILVVDDDEYVRSTLARALRDATTEVRTAASGDEALAACAGSVPEVILSDVRMPDLSGIELLRMLRVRAPTVDVILMTGHDDLPTVAEGMSAGAVDFLVKPMDVTQLRSVIDQVFSDRALREPEADEASEDLEGGAVLVGRDPGMVEVFKVVGQVAAARTGVVVRGESGVGKELVARAIHARSGRSAEPFVAVNCAALPATLLESELFGHVRGAFTGAATNRKGRFAMAGRGTILLDEIGDTSPDFQSKLLRVLQERQYYPVGAQDPEPTHARVIAATHRDLEAMVAAGDFRQDLYYRLRIVEIVVPPLRERLGDIPLLTEHLIRRACQAVGVAPKVLAADALEALMGRSWPGNVRELENCLTRAVVMATGNVIRRDHVQLGSMPPDGTHPQEPHPQEPHPQEAHPLSTLEAVEREHVIRVLEATGNHKSRAAGLLGISRPRLDRLIKKHGLSG